MKLRILTSIASPTWAFQRGDIVTVGDGFGYLRLPRELAERWVGSGIAERIDDPSTPAATVTLDVATREVPETAVVRRGRPPGRR